MIVKIFEDKISLSAAAALQAAAAIRLAIQQHGRARIIAATGASQFDFLAALTAAKEIDWQRVEMFHLDEYVGLPITHPASFRKYLMERLIQKVKIEKYHLLDGETDPQGTADQVGEALRSAPIDVAFVGIGENGHLAFNDPPADLQTEKPYLVVTLDEACRRQQVGEGWFANISDVPTQAISMSVPQILNSREIIAVVPDARKAQALKLCLDGGVGPMAPASVLRTHPAATIYVDKESARLLSPATLTAGAAGG